MTKTSRICLLSLACLVGATSIAAPAFAQDAPQYDPSQMQQPPPQYDPSQPQQQPYDPSQQQQQQQPYDPSQQQQPPPYDPSQPQVQIQTQPQYAVPDAPQGQVDAATIQAALQPYGTWASDPTLGTVWYPAQQAVGNDFVPYGTGGHWLQTDSGWYWQSDYAWGWLPFHYGRWTRANGLWAWVPGTTFAPAWVDWRVSDSYVGWAPLPPLGMAYDMPYAFCTYDAFVTPNFWGNVVYGPRAYGIYARTVAVPPSAGYGGAVYAWGPRPVGALGRAVPVSLGTAWATDTHAARVGVASVGGMGGARPIGGVGAPVAGQPMGGVRPMPVGGGPTGMRPIAPAPSAYNNGAQGYRGQAQVAPQTIVRPMSTYNAPTEVYRGPAPVYNAPAPMYRAPAPAYNAPVYRAPAPAYNAPVYRAQAPVYNAPAPVYRAPAPVYNAPVYRAPAPSYSAPAPVYRAPAPAFRPQQSFGGGGRRR